MSAAWSRSPSRRHSAPGRSAQTIPASRRSCPARPGSGSATRSSCRASRSIGRNMPFPRPPETPLRVPGTVARAAARTRAGAIPAQDTSRTPTACRRSLICRAVRPQAARIRKFRGIPVPRKRYWLTVHAARPESQRVRKGGCPDFFRRHNQSEWVTKQSRLVSHSIAVYSIPDSVHLLERPRK